jgi:endogenous inhibitor of DNA gyrase (YacG/DUF329 family)
MQFNINIPCPVCQTQIPADSNLLLTGMQFSCPTCSAAIGLTQKSTPIVENAINEFKQLRKEVSNLKDNTTE